MPDFSDNISVSVCCGCGFCCLKAKCDAAVRLYPTAKICPQLNWSDEDGRYNCGLMQLPGSVGLAYRQELHAGEGCCSNLNTWRTNVKNRHPVDNASLPLTIDPMFQLFLNCLGKEWMNGDVIVLLLSAFALKLINHMDMTEDEATRIANLVGQYMQNSRPSYMNDFMG